MRLHPGLCTVPQATSNSLYDSLGELLGQMILRAILNLVMLFQGHDAKNVVRQHVKQARKTHMSVRPLDKLPMDWGDVLNHTTI